MPTALPLDSDAPPSASTDAEGERALLRRLRAGDDASFAELVLTYGPRMLAAIRRYLPQDSDSQDALQEAFLSVFKALDQFQGESRLGTWLHRIAVNAALMRIRSQKRRGEQPIEELLPRYSSDGHREDPRSAWSITPDTAAIASETRELVRQCIARLPESYRLVLLLRDIEERSTEETAELLETSVVNVKTRLHRARQALRELLDQHLG